MFCGQCGTSLPDGARFCGKCGAPTTGSGTPASDIPKSKTKETQKDSGEPSLVLKPKFIGWINLFTYFSSGGTLMANQMMGIAFMFLMFPLFGIFGVFFTPGSAGDIFLIIIPGLLFTGLIYGVPIFFGYYQLRKTYEKTEYKFYKDRVEYSEGFWSTTDHSIRYAQITNVTLNRNIIQRKYNLGSMHLVTAAGHGINVKDVEEPEEVYKITKQLVCG